MSNPEAQRGRLGRQLFSEVRDTCRDYGLLEPDDHVLVAISGGKDREFAELCAFPILPCNLCGSQSGLKRERMTQLLDELERESPHLRAVMAQALANVRPTHLLDRDLLEAWADRPDHVRPKLVAPRATRAHHRALPLFSKDKLG